MLNLPRDLDGGNKMVNIVIVTLVVFVGVCIFFFKINYYDPKKDKSKLVTNPAKSKSIICDFMHQGNKEVIGVERVGNKYNVRFHDGTCYPLVESQLELMNPFQVMAGEPAFFTYGAPKSRMKTKELLETVTKLKEEIAIVKASSKEIKDREVGRFADVIRKSKPEYGKGSD